MRGRWLVRDIVVAANLDDRRKVIVI